jgi:hypothetical protein
MHTHSNIVRHAQTTVSVAVAAALLGACNVEKALKVESPNRIPAGGLENPANASLLVMGAVSDFDCAFGSFVVVGGLMGDELEDATQTAARWPYDRRDVLANQTMYATNSCTGLGLYSPLQAARVSATNARRLLESWTDAEVLPANRTQLIGRAAAYEAWSQLLLGEAFCTTVFSTIQGTDFVYGTEISRTEALTQAEATFTLAINTMGSFTDTASVNLLRMAYLGRARTRLDLGNLAGARDDALLVPPGFVYNVTASVVSSRRQNRVYNESNSLGVASSVGAYYRNLNDPRVPVLNRNRTTALGVQEWAQLKYTTAASPIPLATYTEAQLIIAEAEAAANPGTTTGIINTNRAAGNQGNYSGPTDAASLRAEVVNQRRRALFLTGTHLGDVVRYDIVLTNPTGAAFPAGGTFADQRCSQGGLRGYLLPDAERQNNPRLSS